MAWNHYACTQPERRELSIFFLRVLLFHYLAKRSNLPDERESWLHTEFSLQDDLNVAIGILLAIDDLEDASSCYFE